MHIVYSGLLSENEYFSSIYKSVWAERFVFKVYQKNMVPVLINIVSCAID